MPALLSALPLIDQAIAALRRGDMGRGAELLAQIIATNANHEQAWLWLSATVSTPAEKRFCLERVQAINPQNAAAQQGLQTLPAGAQPPAVAHTSNANMCSFPGCAEPIARVGHSYCYRHWQAIYRPASQARSTAPISTPVAPTPTAPLPAATAPLSAAPHNVPATPQLLTDSALAEELGVPDPKAILSELGWIGKAKNGWTLTPQGSALGALQKFHPQTGAPYMLWPANVLHNNILRASVRALKEQDNKSTSTNGDSGFRKKFSATHRTTDGHLVRSKAEALIDNWLYMSGIVHAYERRLPIEEEAFCDFYIPAGKVYIEYWGLENDSKYLARKQAKQDLYHKYQLNLIELNNEQLLNLDDLLPKLLLKFGVLVS